jgi:HPt (histidine-containing phosphotransfer) domain-containing protein
MTDLERDALASFVNWPDLLQRVDNDRELLEELFALFQEEFPRLLDELHQTVKDDDLAEIRRVAHALKGMLAGLSIQQCAALAANVESAAQAGDRSEVAQVLAALDRETSGLMAAVKSFKAETDQ